MAFYAGQFGLDCQERYGAIFEDLGIRHVRIPIYWNDVEGRPGEYDFTAIDWQIAEAEKYDAEVVAALGQKLPRWPECHLPEWALGLAPEARKEALLKYIKTVIERYSTSQAVKTWQIENEPFLPFGECQDKPSLWLDEEIALARSLDSSRPGMVTDSGELSLWITAANRPEGFG